MTYTYTCFEWKNKTWSHDNAWLISFNSIIMANHIQFNIFNSIHEMCWQISLHPSLSLSLLFMFWAERNIYSLYTILLLAQFCNLQIHRKCRVVNCDKIKCKVQSHFMRCMISDSVNRIELVLLWSINVWISNKISLKSWLIHYQH